jgi:hypothetical protein
MKGVQHHGFWDKAGKLQCESFTKELRALKDKGVPVVLTVAEFKEKRSSPQNRYYWGCVVDTIHKALKESGWEISAEGTHELLRVRFLSEDHPIGNDGEFVTRVRSTTELDREEFGIYLEKCQQFAAEYLNVVIPEAGQQVAMEVNN